MSTMTRREWIAAAAAIGAFRPPAQQPDPALTERISRLIHEYEEQGYHRTGTQVDRMSGNWLADEVSRAGAIAEVEAFGLSRVDPIACTVTVGSRRIEGLPLFDGAFTDRTGLSGRLGLLGSNAEIALTETPTNASAAGALGEARRGGRHVAIVCLTRGARVGLCPSNADAFLKPFGPPVLQVSSAEGDYLTAKAAEGAQARVIAYVIRNGATALNVAATIAGSDSSLPPFVVMTPRSGWYRCASERGGGIACWLEIIRAFARSRPSRTLQFVASSGHELGHLGINAYVDKRPDVVKNSAGWLHLGANIGAAAEPATTLQASDDEMDARLSRELAAAGLNVDRRVPRGTVPGGEAEVVHRGGGRYVSIIGRNAWFHHRDDRGPSVIDPAMIARFSRAFIALVRTLA